jgi:hypothetical protein
MKFLKLMLILAFIAGCTRQLPESYGVYVYSGKGRLTLSTQKIHFTGNLFQSITGLRNPSGVGFSSMKNIIVLEKNIDPKSIRLSRL